MKPMAGCLRIAFLAMLACAFHAPLHGDPAWRLISNYGPSGFWNPVVEDLAGGRLLVLNHFSYPWELALEPSYAWTQPPVEGGVPAWSLGPFSDPLRRRGLGFDYSGQKKAWELPLDGNPLTWSMIPLTGTWPSPGPYGNLGAYDPVRDRLVFLASPSVLYQVGLTGTASWGDNVPLQGSRPNELSPWAYDPVRHRIVCPRGASLYSLSLDDPSGAGPLTWTQEPISGPPPPLYPPVPSRPAYDARRHRLLAFGLSMHLSTDITWSLSLGSSPAWTQIPSFGPQERYGARSYYDRLNDALVIGGGQTGEGRIPPPYDLEDNWALDFGMPFDDTVVLTPTNVLFGETSEPRTRAVVVTNLGSTDLVATAVSSDDPAIAVTPTSFTLAPGHTTRLLVTWTPDAPTLNALLRIETTEPETPVRTVALRHDADLTVGIPDGPSIGDALRLTGENPARGVVRFELSLAGPRDIEVSVYDERGRRLRRLAHEAMPAGRRAFKWDGLDDAGRRVSPGLFFLRAAGREVDLRIKVARLE